MLGYFNRVIVRRCVCRRSFASTPTRVEIFRRGDEIVLRHRRGDAQVVFDALISLPDDFMAEGRDDELLQERLAF